MRHQDPAREVSLLLTASGTLVGLTALAMWSTSLVLTMSGLDGWVINGIGDQLLPVAAALVAAGVICLLVVPYVVSLLVTWRRWYRLRPLWTELVSRYPQVHLELRTRGGLLTRLQFRSERMIIETLDALRIAPVGEPCPETTGVEAVARFLAKGPAAEGDVHAAELLEHSESRDADVDQLVALAEAFVRLHCVAA